MRLTLRTLLAYLDDILEPAQAKEIGEKIAESPVASELAGRIRETLRRRRITAPQISGPGSGPDPNLTAEYLDLTLSAEGVAEFEKLCMDSDVHLAEVAACHQILTLVLGEPADVSSELRERMYALGAEAGPESDSNGESVQSTPEPAAERSGSDASVAASTSRPASFEEGLPQQLRRKSLTTRIIPAAIVLICAGWLVLLYTDPFLRDQQTERQAEPDSGLVAALTPDDQNGGPGGESTPQPESQDEGAPGDPQTVVDPSTEGDAVVEPAEPTVATEPEPGLVAAETETPDESATVAGTDPGATAPDPAVPHPDPEAFQEPPAAPVEPAMVLYNSPEGILLHRNAEAGEWTVLPRRSLLHAGDEIACPDPFTARLQIDEGGCLITLTGGTRIRFTGASEAGAFGFKLLRGRVGAFMTASDPPADDPVRFGLRAAGQSYSVKFLTPGTWCGFDLVPPQPHGKAEPPEAWKPGGGIFVARGSVQLVDPSGASIALLPETGWRSWVAGDPGAPVLAVPNWLSPDGAALPANQRRYVKLYSDEFPLDQAVWQSIPAIVRDRRPMLSQFAVETLALTGNYSELLRALTADHQESRLAAIVGLREWLAADASHAELLAEELGMSFRDADAAAIEELLWGYTIEDGRDPATSARLVDWLRNDNVAVRELALFHIEMLTGRDNDFHPTAPLAQREAAVGRWQDYLRRHGSLLPAE